MTTKRLQSVYIEEKLLGDLDHLSAKIGISRNKLISNLLEIGVDEVMGMDKVGLVRFARFIRDMSDRVSGRLDRIAGGKVAVRS